MRVCIFTDTLGDLNGVSRFIQDIGKQSLSFGFDLHIVTSTHKPIPQMPNVHNIKPWLRFPMPMYPDLDLAFASKKQMTETLRDLDPDIVHISTPGPLGYMMRTIAKDHGYSIMGTYHTDISAYVGVNTKSGFLKRTTDRFMAKFYDGFSHVFTRSKEYISIMADDICIDARDITYLKPGTDLKTFHPSHHNPDFFKPFGLSRRGIKALYVGRITKDKNILFLIDVWKEVRRQNPNVTCDLFLAGEGYHRKLAPKLKEERIHFLGPVVGSELSKLYASSDLFLFPSVADTLGQVVMEAQASGLPVVVSDQGGPQSMVNSNGRQSGFIAKGNDRDDWVVAVNALLHDAKLRQRLGKQGHANMTFFNIENSFKHFASMHEQVWEEQDML